LCPIGDSRLATTESVPQVDRPARLTALGRLYRLPANLDYLAVRQANAAGLADLRDGEGGQFAPAEAVVGGGAGNQLVAVAVPPTASAWPSR
jgi:hypothetical protein